MNRKAKLKFSSIIARYSLLLLFAVLGVGIFYFIFKPLTLHLSYLLFEISFKPYILNDAIYFYNSNISFEVIGACVAGSAYLLFLILNLSTPDIKIKKRISLLFISFLAFLIINALRIFFIGSLFLNSAPFAEAVHKFLWYFGSVFMVILIWFVEVKAFNIKEIPFYSDLKFVFNYVKKR